MTIKMDRHSLFGWSRYMTLQIFNNPLKQTFLRIKNTPLSTWVYDFILKQE